MNTYFASNLRERAPAGISSQGCLFLEFVAEGSTCFLSHDTQWLVLTGRYVCVRETGTASGHRGVRVASVGRGGRFTTLFAMDVGGVGKNGFEAIGRKAHVSILAYSNVVHAARRGRHAGRRRVRRCDGTRSVPRYLRTRYEVIGVRPEDRQAYIRDRALVERDAKRIVSLGRSGSATTPWTVGSMSARGCSCFVASNWLSLPNDVLWL